jgi:hypothetical protein
MHLKEGRGARDLPRELEEDQDSSCLEKGLALDPFSKSKSQFQVQIFKLQDPTLTQNWFREGIDLVKGSRAGFCFTERELTCRAVSTWWTTTLSSKVNLHRAINFRAFCGANLVTLRDKFPLPRNLRTPPCGRAFAVNVGRFSTSRLPIFLISFVRCVLFF